MNTKKMLSYFEFYEILFTIANSEKNNFAFAFQLIELTILSKSLFSDFLSFFNALISVCTTSFPIEEKLSFIISNETKYLL